MSVVDTVTVVIDGRIVASSPPPYLRAGAVVASPRPYLDGIATTIVVDPRTGLIVLRSGEHSVVLRPGSRVAVADRLTVILPVAPSLASGGYVVPLGAVVRALGGHAVYDRATRTLALFAPPPRDLRATGAEAIPNVPPGPFVTFTPQPSAPSSLAPAATAVPRPRRTAITLEDPAPRAAP